jgi:hypothetical protein
MGEFRFRLPDDWTLVTRQASSIHVVGLDGIPWPCRVFTEGNTLVIRRNRDESGKIYIAYPFAKHGEYTICTGSLPERSEPYDLLTELARGTLNRLRNQISIWQEGGLQIDGHLTQQTAAAIELLGDSILAQDKFARDKQARRSMETAFDVLFDLSLRFGQRVSRFRVSQTEFSQFWMAAAASDSFEFEGSANQRGFELVQLEPEMLTASRLKAVEEQPNRKRVIVGPLFDASAGGMSAELMEMDDFDQRKRRVLTDCRTALEEMPTATSLLHVVSGLNGLGHRHLGYPQQLQLTIDMLHLLEESSCEIPNLISFDFPWAERLASSVGGIHPLQIADTLLRQGLGISFLGLDVNLDYWPGGSAVRDPLQWIDLIDIWSQLGLPLILCLRLPTGNAETPTADPRRIVNEVRSNLTDQQRLELIETVIPMMIARPSVHGLIFRQWCDCDDPRFPNGGLAENDGAVKPIVGILEKIRETYL